MPLLRNFAVIAFLATFLLNGEIGVAHKLKGDPEAIDILVKHDDGKLWKQGSFSGTEIAAIGKLSSITLKKDLDGKFAQQGYYESPKIEAGFLYREVLPSWNIVTPPNTGYAVQILVEDEKGQQSEWYYIISHNAPTSLKFEKVKKDALGEVDIDYWMGSPVKYVKYRVWLFTRDVKVSPMLKRFFLALRGTKKDNPNYSLSEDSSGRVESSRPIPEKFNTKAPFKYQSEVGDKDLWGRICCPTSVAVMLGAFGLDVETTKTVQMCYDAEYNFYGTWPRAAQTISKFGLVSYVRRFKNLDEARQILAQGTPIMASIKVEEGQLPEAYYKSLPGGHIIVLTGYEGKEWFIVNDPASRNRKLVYQVKYSATGIQKVWINRGGVGIIAFPEN